MTPGEALAAAMAADDAEGAIAIAREMKKAALVSAIAPWLELPKLTRHDLLIRFAELAPHVTPGARRRSKLIQDLSYLAQRIRGSAEHLEQAMRRLEAGEIAPDSGAFLSSYEHPDRYPVSCDIRDAIAWHQRAFMECLEAGGGSIPTDVYARWPEVYDYPAALLAHPAPERLPT